jgi:hypothetical protein
MNYTTRRHPRTLREAFREWPETCYGVERPIVIQTCPSIWVRIANWLWRM